MRLLRLLAAGFLTLSTMTCSFAAAPTSLPFTQQMQALEKASGGRLGVAALNTTNQQTLAYRDNERFAFCSTSKVLAVADLLKQSMTQPNLLQQKITYSKNEIVEYSPVTSKHVSEGMTLSDLSAAALTQSDNTAMNLLLKQLGGPAAVTQFARAIGDNTFRLDRNEPSLNTAIPGDPRDTTSPKAMVADLQTLVLTNKVLGTAQTQQLQAWLKANTTGNGRIRAGVPQTWVVGDKTGTGDYGTSNDIGVIWPPHCQPIVLAVYYTQTAKDAAPKDAVIAAATRLVLKQYAKTDACVKGQMN